MNICVFQLPQLTTQQVLPLPTNLSPFKRRETLHSLHRTTANSLVSCNAASCTVCNAACSSATSTRTACFDRGQKRRYTLA